jgi:hypothetical protein
VQLVQLLYCPTQMGHCRLASGSDLLEHADIEEFMKADEKCARWQGEYRLYINHIQIGVIICEKYTVYVVKARLTCI